MKAVGEKGEAGQQEVKFENGKWYLWNGTEFVEFKASAETTGNVPYYYTDPNDQNYAILVVYDKDGKNEQKLRLPLNEGLAQITVVQGNTLSFNYAISKEGAGWALTDKRTFQDQGHQDQLDAATIYSILENEILPLYYARNRKGYSEGWVKTIKNSIAQVAPHYTMKRQLDDYYAKFYTKEAKRFKELVANDYAKAKELAAWKERVAELWDSIEIVSCEKTEELASGNIESGKEYIITYVIDEKGLDDAVGIELVTTFTNAEGKEHIYSVEPMEVIKKEGNLYTFQVKHSLSNSGSFKVAYRMFPKNVDLPHRQDFCYVRWFN